MTKDEAKGKGKFKQSRFDAGENSAGKIAPA